MIVQKRTYQLNAKMAVMTVGVIQIIKNLR